jgi:hypothetical protein
MRGLKQRKAVQKQDVVKKEETRFKINRRRSDIEARFELGTATVA